TDPTPDPAPQRRGRRRALIATLAAASLVTGGGIAVAAAHKTVELDVDGGEQTVSTFAGSVAGLLAEQDLPVAERDGVGPDTVAASRSRDGSREALDMPLVNGAPVDVVVDDETVRVQPIGEAYLQDVLDLAGVSVGKLDDVVVGAGQDGVVSVTITRGTHELRTEAETLPFETVEREDDALYVGERRVLQEGVEGRRVRATLVVNAAGRESASEPSGYYTVSEPVEEIVAVGTKPRPAP